jgi:hypothetical protein
LPTKAAVDGAKGLHTSKGVISKFAGGFEIHPAAAQAVSKAGMYMHSVDAGQNNHLKEFQAAMPGVTATPPSGCFTSRVSVAHT